MRRRSFLQALASVALLGPLARRSEGVVAWKAAQSGPTLARWDIRDFTLTRAEVEELGPWTPLEEFPRAAGRNAIQIVQRD